MSWLQKLYETFETCSQHIEFTTPDQREGEAGALALMPVSHTGQQAHIEVTIDEKGNFIEAALLPLKRQFTIPATEDSAGRTSGEAPHPLADKIHYCGKDYKGTKKNLFHLYEAQLKAWCDSPYSHPKVEAVYAYVSRGTLVADLLHTGILHADSSGALLTETSANDKDTIFKRLTPKNVKGATVRDQGEAVVVWSVLSADGSEMRTWKDVSLQKAWMEYDASRMRHKALCMVGGKEASISSKHPRNVRRPGDGAKLISSNDNDGFTFRGRFLIAEEACTVGYEVSYKIHNALRWLIARQGYRNGDQAVVVWSAKGVPVPNAVCWNPMAELELSVDVEETDQDFFIEPEKTVHKDVGEEFALRVKKALRGYRESFVGAEGIAVLALDAAGPGRLSVVFYREQIAGEYLNRLERWQHDVAWPLPLSVKPEKGAGAKVKGKVIFTPYAPLPETIAKVAYGRRIDEKLLKATVERLLPCIVDNAAIPFDLVESCVRRACNRASLEDWEWPGVLGTACALYKGFHARHPQSAPKGEYSMSLDRERKTRDYLYGRLLATAEYIEKSALNAAEEKRPTNAERLMQRFADHPYATWRDLEKHINPYMLRLQSREDTRGKYVKAKRVLQEICDAVADIEDFASSRKLEGEFLLGYHCQLSDLYKKKAKADADSANKEGEYV